MPFTTELDHKNKVVVHVGAGVIAVDQILAQLETFFRDTPVWNAIWDLQQGDVAGLSSDDVLTMKRFVEKRAHLRGQAKTAWVAPDDKNFGICRMTEQRSNDMPYARRSFRTRDEALAWITAEG